MAHIPKKQTVEKAHAFDLSFSIIITCLFKLLQVEACSLHGMVLPPASSKRVVV